MMQIESIDAAIRTESMRRYAAVKSAGVPFAEVAAAGGATCPADLAGVAVKPVHIHGKRRYYADASGELFYVMAFGQAASAGRCSASDYDRRMVASILLPLEQLSRFGIKPSYYR
jgi:hypothetical protein